MVAAPATKADVRISRRDTFRGYGLLGSIPISALAVDSDTRPTSSAQELLARKITDQELILSGLLEMGLPLEFFLGSFRLPQSLVSQTQLIMRAG